MPWMLGMGYIGITWLLTLRGEGGKIDHRCWELHFMTELWQKDVKDWFQPVLYIYIYIYIYIHSFFPHSHPSFICPSSPQ